MQNEMRDGFEAVDRMPNPERYVAVMEAAHAEPQVVEQKRRWLELLDLRAGDRVLDLGCGTGADALTLAAAVGTNGLVVGVDSSRTMLAAARANAQRSGLALAPLCADATALPLPTDAFACCWCDRVVQHLADPAGAVAELARVTRPGGRIVVGGPDFGTQVLDLDDRVSTRAILDFRCDRRRRQGWIGRQLPRLFADAGLVDVIVYPTTVAVWGTPSPSLVAELEDLAQQATAVGAISGDAGAGWLAQVRKRAASGRWFSSHTSFTVCGRAPAR